MPRLGERPVGKQSYTCFRSGCGKTFERYASTVKNPERVFCSRACQDLVGSKPRRGEERVCALDGCEVTFYVKPSEDQFYCSVAHVGASQKVERLSFTCEHCGTEFQVVPGTAKYNANRFCKKDCEKAFRLNASIGRRKVRKDGYVEVRLPDHPNAQPSTGFVLEHIVVMAEHLGRPLLKPEEVHHLNGVRDDNRLENLELWNTSQPAGQRVVDKVEFAKRILALYEPEVLRRVTVDREVVDGEVVAEYGYNPFR